MHKKSWKRLSKVFFIYVLGNNAAKILNFKFCPHSLILSYLIINLYGTHYFDYGKWITIDLPTQFPSSMSTSEALSVPCPSEPLKSENMPRAVGGCQLPGGVPRRDQGTFPSP